VQEADVAARAIWKGVIRIGRTTRLPVKLFSAVQDQTVHFRLLHRADKQPVKQKLVNPETGDTVEYKDVRKAYPLGRGRLLVLDDEDLEKLTPEPSRDIEITRFVDPEDIDHRWYERAYYLGPDGSAAGYAAAAAALAKKKKEGVARWVMRGKEYAGALRAENGVLLLIVLRHADEVIDADALKPPTGRPLEKRELAMAKQLVQALEAEFDPGAFQDTYRERVMDLIETKRKGRKPKVVKFRKRKASGDALEGALRASLRGLKKGA
jgi:DNA end-binding protein Ku